MTALDLMKSHQVGAESLVLIIDDSAAQRVVAAWPTLGEHDLDRPLKKNETYPSVFDDLMRKALNAFSMEQLAEQSNVPFTHCERIFYRLMRAGIIYPDGTISKLAKDFLGGQVMAHVRGMIPRGKSNGRS